MKGGNGTTCQSQSSSSEFVARYIITNSSDWSISVGYTGAEFTFLYARIQVLVEAQTFTSGNISEAN